MARGSCGWRELAERWRGILEAEAEYDDEGRGESRDHALSSVRRRVHASKEKWFSDTYNFLIKLPRETHIWCGCWELMGPLLETFHNLNRDKKPNSPLLLLWKRISQELRQCTQCVCQHHQAQEAYAADYEFDSVGSLLKTLRCLDEQRVVEHIKEINEKIVSQKYDPEHYSSEVVSIMFEVLTFPTLLDDRSLVTEFQTFIEEVESSHDVALSGHQQYPGVYALLFLKSSKARAIGLRLAKSMGKMRTAADLEPLQPLLRKYIGFLETEVLPSDTESSRPRVEHERLTVWLGIKTLLGFLEAPAFEEGILERYPVFLSIVLNHVSDDTPEFSYSITCLKLLFEMLGCKLWLRTTLSPSVMRNTLLGQSFHTRNEKSHKEIFDLFLPFLQSLEALQDGEHEKQRRHLIYFLLHQVMQSSNFGHLMRKNACKIALFIVHRGYKMNPPCPPTECAHMWGPSLVRSLKDLSLHSSLRQPAFDLMQTILVSDAAALASIIPKYSETPNFDVTINTGFENREDDVSFSYEEVENENSCWDGFRIQGMHTSQDCEEWSCVPMLWIDVLVDVDPSILPISFCKAVMWAVSRFPMLAADTNVDNNLLVRDWISVHTKEILRSLNWEIPRGSDDGGEGRESINSVRASSTCIPLLKSFKRCCAHFMVQVEKRDLHRQFIWEPKMAESLVLCLIDPNDAVRQAERIILESVSNTQGLTSGLQFLCSASSSLSAMLMGLKHALNQVLSNSRILCFRDLHHLFFIIVKLMKDVDPAQRATNILREDSNCSKFASGGGFLHQPVFGSLPDKSEDGILDMVDLQSWKSFSCLLSVSTWPCIRSCLVKGKEFIDDRGCQMSCVRILEVIPVAFERMSMFSAGMSRNIETVRASVLDFQWLADLADWGRSSLVVVIRHWKKSIITLLGLMKSFFGDSLSSSLGIIETMISSDDVRIDNLKEKLFEVSASTLKLSSKLDSLHSENYHGKPHILDTTYPYMKDLHIDKVHVTSEDRVFNRSDDERKNLSLNDDKLNVTSGTVTSHAHVTRKSPKSMSFVRKRFMSQSNVIDLTDEPQFVSEAMPSTDNSIVTEFNSGNRVKENKNVSSSSKEVITCCQSSSSAKEIGSLTYAFPGESKHSVKKLSDKVESVQVSSSIRSLPGKSDQISAQTENTENGKKGNLPKDTIFDSDTDDDDDDDKRESASYHTQNLVQLKKPSVSFPKRKVIQLDMRISGRYGALKRLDNGAIRVKPPKLDDWYRPILEIDYFSIIGLSSEGFSAPSFELKEVPLSFTSPDHYIQIFRPLVLEEFKAQLHSSFVEASSSDEMFCGSLCILSVERVDDFHIVRARPEDGESARAFLENDLILLTKEPLKNESQHIHAVGKLERRERNDKSRTTVFVIRFYLQGNSSRLIRVTRLLIERSKWHISRIMSITPQLREFQALSSLSYIPMLPVILRPTDCRESLRVSEKADLGSLSPSLQKVLTSSFNGSQLQAISVAIQGGKGSFGVSLIQGPPGTGKTRTIVAITSALLSSCSSKKPSRQDTTTPTNRPRISQSAALARAWQDAALAKQLMKDDEALHANSAQKSNGVRVLICAQSNAAVDELVSRMKGGIYGDDGIMYRPYLVRVGNVKTVHPDSLPIFIDTLVNQRMAEDKNVSDQNTEVDGNSSASLQAKLEKLVESIRLYESTRAIIQDHTKISEDGASKEDVVGDMNHASIEAKLKVLYAQKKTLCTDINAAQARERKLAEENKHLRQKARKSVLREAQIVLTTLSGCGGDLYTACSDSSHRSRLGDLPECSLFDAVIIDEAAQALEPATLIPLQLLKSNGTKCVMVGDPKQLPATVLSSLASKFLYECSMFERMQRAGHPVIMLTEQYRMHPEICRFPSTHFYDNKLLNGILMSSKSSPFHETPNLGPYMFFDVTDGRENHGRRQSSLSLYNDSEADMAVEIIKFFKERYPIEYSSKRIGVITPYKSQLSLLRSRFSGALGSSVVADLEFNTVDGFQGREVDVLLLSTVRASPSNSRDQENGKSKSIGFVADVRRMNVALTRAKHSLWIIGNARTLQTNPHWGALVKDAMERNLFVSVAKPYSSVFHVSKIARHAKGEKPKSNTRPVKKEAKQLQVTDKGQRSSVTKDNKFSDASMRNKSKRTDDLQASVSNGKKEKDTKSDAEKDHPKNPQEEIILKRKRQREAVDALLSSSLISSRKPEISSKPASKRRPPSTGCKKN